MELFGFDLSVLLSKAIAVLLQGVTALLIFLIGKMVARKVADFAKNMMEKSKLDHTLASFLGNMLFIVLMVIVVMAALGRVGVDTTSIVAIMGGAAVAVGLALQDQLSNFAAGVLIIMFRPFNKGDYVGVDGHEGTIEDISIISTSLKTLNNHEVIVPNSHMTSGALVNYTSLPNRRVDVTVGIAYDADIKLAKETMLAVAKRHELVFSDPQPMVMVKELGESSVDLALHVWSSNADWKLVQCDLLEEIKYAFDDKGIEIPFPHRVLITKPA